MADWNTLFAYLRTHLRIKIARNGLWQGKIVVSVGVMLLGAASAWAQEPRVFTYTLDTLPPALVLQRGDVLQFTGVGPRTGEPQIFAIRAGDEVRVRATVQNSWKLRYNSQPEHFAACTLAVMQQINNEWQIRARTKLRIVPSPLFRIAAPAPETRVTELVRLRVEALGEERAERIGYTLDGKPLGLFANRQEEAVWDPGTAARGAHLLGAVVKLTDGSLYTLEPIAVTVAPKLRSLPFPTGETLDLSAVNGNVLLRADVDPAMQPRAVTYLVDGKSVVERREPPFGQAWWNPDDLPNGHHALTIDVENAAGQHAVSAPLPFDVARSERRRAMSTEEPFVATRPMQGLEPETVYPTVESALLAHKRVTVPIARLPERLAVAAGTYVALTGVSEAANDTEVAAYVDGLRQSGFNGRGKFVLPVSTQTLMPGLHTLKIRQNLTGGITRPVRQSRLLVFEGAPVQMQPLEEGASAFQPLTLRAQIGPGFTLHSLQYFADGRPLPSDPAAPETAQFDPRSRQPGTHALWVVGTDEEGGAFRSAPLAFKIPVRVRLETLPRLVVVTKANHALPVKAAFAPQLAPVQVRLLVDGSPGVAQTRPPFNMATLELAHVPPGAHTLAVEARDADNAVYISVPAHFEVQNAAWNTPRAQPKTRQSRKAKITPARSGKHAHTRR